MNAFGTAISGRHGRSTASAWAGSSIFVRRMIEPSTTLMPRKTSHEFPEYLPTRKTPQGVAMLGRLPPLP